MDSCKKHRERLAKCERDDLRGCATRCHANPISVVRGWQ